MKIVVIGAGSIGANIAYCLPVQGAKVVLVEGRTPSSGTSSASLAWLSTFPQASWKEDSGRARLRMKVHDTFDALKDEIGGEWLHWTGTLTWASSICRERMAKDFAVCRDRGVDLEMLDGKGASALAPQVTFQDDDQVIFERHSGWVDAPILIHVLLGRLQDLGGSVSSGKPVVEILRTGDRIIGVRLLDDTIIHADVVVNAAGSWGTHVAAMADVALPLELIPGLVVYTAAMPDKLPTQVISAPTWIARPDPSGGLAVHWRGEELTSVHGKNGPSPQAIVDDIAKIIPALKGTRVQATPIGVRAIPPGGPTIGALPWLEGMYFAISHGGIGWGPTWGQLAARELLQGELVPELAGLRPGRFYTEHSALGRFADDAEQGQARIRLPSSCA